jgi:hypothetical protein
MSKSLTSLTLALVLTFAASANAEGDVYEEAIWDIHAAAPAVTGKTGEIAKLARQTPQRKNTQSRAEIEGDLRQRIEVLTGVGSYKDCEMAVVYITSARSIPC